MTLHLYFARKFLKNFVSVFFILLAILTLTALIEQIRRFGGFDDAGFGTLLVLAFLSVPEDLYKVLPLIMILATVSMVLGLARSSELVVTRAAGRPALKSLTAPRPAGFPYRRCRSGCHEPDRGGDAKAA